ncbi:MAG TPA: bi-domain-containing oxidoreductase [Gemmatimonadaceae bacterium]
MKSLTHSLSTGALTLLDAPLPGASPRTIVVESRASVISAGTERMLVEFGRAGLLEKARRQPDKVKQVLDKVRTDGLSTTLSAVRAKLDQPIPLGYCNAGVVVEAGAASGFAAGDRVVTNGPHAEYVRVARTLAARIPDGVSFECAAFTPVAAIGLQGIRLAAPTLGETVVVYGLGLIGLLAVQLLRANGCRVLGIDRDAGRLALAERFGALAIDGSAGDTVARVLAHTNDAGADAVLLTLASDSNEPVHEAAQFARHKGRLVLVGVTGLDLRRDDFYKKELSFAVSCSYGPGRYDPMYEEQGVDYPLGHVRWTERRNFDAVLALMADGRLDPSLLVSHHFAFDRARDAYDVLAGGEPCLGIVLTYPEHRDGVPAPMLRTVVRSSPKASPGATSIAIIGAGNFATRTLLPALRADGVRLHTIASGNGTSAAIAADKFGFERATTDLDAIFSAADIDAVFVLTRHDTHADLAVRALRAGKHVFVEKPLGLTEEDVERVADAAQENGRMLMVGFNRRFAPLTAELQRKLAGRGGPLATVITVNAGAIPRDHWTQDAEQGGGRIIGEACHFIDLARALTGSPITSLHSIGARTRDGSPVGDIATITLGFGEGSVAAIHYIASGSRSYPKERVECFFDGRTVTIDNWRRIRDWGTAMPWKRRTAGAQDKGHAAELHAWMRAVRDGGPPPIALDEIVDVSRWAVKAAAPDDENGGGHR